MNRLSEWYDRHRGARSIVIGWLVTRVLMLLILATKAERFMVGDVYYYHRKLSGLFEVGLPQTLNEYPTPVVWILLLPYGATGGSRVGYLVAFLLFMLLLDAAFTLALYRSAGRKHGWAVDFWLLFVFLIGALSYLRFDMLPAVLAGGALLAARRRPWVTGALTGLGAAIKLWPALLIPAFLSYRRDRKPAGLAFLGVGVGLALISLLIGGWTRLFSPLTWQSDRGLQIESIWATPLMVARAIQPAAWVVDISKYQAYEIVGPGVAAWLVVSNVATVLGLVFLVLLFVRAFRSGGSTPVAVGFLIVATVAIMIMTNKTLSPQYLLWLGGPAAALLVLRPKATADESRAIGRVAVQLLILALLNHLVYPLLYDGFLGRNGQAMIVVSTLVTGVRNVALVLFTVEVCRMAWRFLGSDNRFGQGG
jgi:hypothetical protein